MRDQRLHVLVTERERAALRAAAERDERTVSELVREAVKREIRRIAREQPPGEQRG